MSPDFIDPKRNTPKIEKMKKARNKRAVTFIRGGKAYTAT